ncbi:MAG TPA: heme transporter HemC [Rhodospirillaceae bacterium]|nr:heme transporter HemC [Rhodospirillaceae bacterium]HAT36108.1 heme transporter HemC [Rhodospirillaceae bacterium]
MHRNANPIRFLKFANAASPWIGGAMVLGFVIGLYLALFASPADYQQSDTVRIMYIHVPAAWMAVLTYALMATASAAALIWQHPLAFFSAKAAAPIGAAFTIICLATGSLWGKPMWGTWWVWDARLTSVLILLFLYLGYLALVNAFDDPERGQKAASLLAVVGVINLPIIKYSVDWWNTLHQPASVIRLDGPAIHPDMLWPLLIMAFAFKMFLMFTLIIRIKGELVAASLRNAQLGLQEG